MFKVIFDKRSKKKFGKQKVFYLHSIWTLAIVEYKFIAFTFWQVNKQNVLKSTLKNKVRKKRAKYIK